MLKKIRNRFKLAKFILTCEIHPDWFKVVQQVMDFVNEVHHKKQPMLFNVAVINYSIKEIPEQWDIVSLWAGVGETNPIERVKHLRNQRDAMKELLKDCLNKVEKDSPLWINIKLALDTF